jgi:simple sugar transport system permease protein
MASAWAGYAIKGLPLIIHLPIALLFGVIFGGITGYIAGALKAYRGIHEVITTIMLNSLVLQLVEYLAYGPWKEKGQIIARTPLVQKSAVIPKVFGMPLGFAIAVALAIAAWWIMKNTTSGFRLETVGRNKNAAWYSGISVKRTFIIAMVAGGALAGLGGAIETLGVVGRFESAFNAGLGFDGITIALLGRANPLGVIPGAILFGGMRGAGPNMQFDAGVAPEVIDLILAVVLFFVTAPLLGKWFKSLKSDQTTITGGWGN